MKKLVILLIAGLLCLSFFVACTDHSSSDYTKNDYSYSSTPSSPKELSDSEKKDLAEKELVEYLAVRCPNGKYSIGSISVDKFGDVIIRGKLYRYDAYGNYKNTELIDATITFSDEGTARVKKCDLKAT